jgi:hypothetical protein
MAMKKDIILDWVLLILSSPILMAQVLRRGLERYRFFRLAMEPAMACECGTTISLVGYWRCSCGFTYRGHLLRICPVCGSIPCVARCYRCQVTTKLPESS